MPGASLSRMKFRVLAEKSESAKSRHGQKHSSHDFKPELVRDSPESSERGSNGPSGGTDRAVAAGLLTRDTRHHAEFLPRGNFAHVLDFSSLERYNDATAAKGEPFFQPRHLRSEGESWIRN
jgi:hypothetical protein